jgi:hypothetical protein
MAGQGLTQSEVYVLRVLVRASPDKGHDLANKTYHHVPIPTQSGVDQLIRKGCVKSVGITRWGTVLYALNPFGYALAEFAERELPAVIERSNEGTASNSP